MLLLWCQAMWAMPANASDLVAKSMLEQATLDRAAANVLRQKFATGLFDGSCDAYFPHLFL
jgi:hypothetical protein